MRSQSLDCPGELRLVSLGVGMSICTEGTGLAAVAPSVAVPRHRLACLAFLISSAVADFTPRADLQQRGSEVAGCWMAGGTGGLSGSPGVLPGQAGVAGCAIPMLGGPARRSGVPGPAGCSRAGQGCRRALALPQLGEGGLHALQVPGCSFPKSDVAGALGRAPSAMSPLVFSGRNLLNSG